MILHEYPSISRTEYWWQMDRLEVGLKLSAIRTRKLAEAGKDDDYILTDPMIRVIETIEAIRAEKRKKV